MHLLLVQIMEMLVQHHLLVLYVLLLEARESHMETLEKLKVELVELVQVEI